MKAGSPEAAPKAARRGRGRPPAAPADLEAAHAAARDRICGAALSLFERGGIDAISMREIAGEIGVSPMMPYKYFPTKDHLLQELRSRSFAQLEAAMLAASAATAPPRERLEQMILAYLRFGLEDQKAYRLMFDYWIYESPSRMLEDFGDAIRRQAGAWNRLLEGVEAYFAEIGSGGDSMTAAHLIWSALHGLVSLEASRKLVMGRSFEDLTHPLIVSIMGGLAPQPQPA